MYWPRAIFEACAWMIGLFMLRQLRFGGSKKSVDPKHRQVCVGNRLVEELWVEIKEWGFASEFSVFTKPNANLFKISVFALDPLAPRISELGHKRGFEVFRVEIHQKFFGLTIFEDGRAKRFCFRRTEEQMIKDAKEMLFYTISQLVCERPAR